MLTANTPVPVRNPCPLRRCTGSAANPLSGFDRPTSRPDTLNARSRPSNPSATSGKPSTKRWPRSMPPFRRSSRISRRRLATSEATPRLEEQLSSPARFCYGTQFVDSAPRVCRLAHVGRMDWEEEVRENMATVLSVATTLSTVRLGPLLWP